MRTTWQRRQGRDEAVTAPVSLIVSAFAPVPDVRRTLTPLLRARPATTTLLLIDLGGGRRRLGGSALAQVYGQLGNEVPDLDDPGALGAFFESIQRCARQDACSRTTTAPTAGCSRRWPKWRSPRAAVSTSTLDGMPASRLPALFAEELGAVVQVRAADADAILRAVRATTALAACAIGAPTRRRSHPHRASTATLVLDEARIDLQRAWSATTHAMQTLRDNPDVADQEYERMLDAARSRPLAATDVRSRRRRRRALRRTRRAARAWRSCASRASTARSRWRPRSTAPASTPSTCT